MQDEIASSWLAPIEIAGKKARDLEAGMVVPQRMETQLLQAEEAGAIAETAAALRRGELAVFPTDTVYGVGANVVDEQAILQLFAAKQRPRDKGIPILLADLDDLDKVAAHVTRSAQRFIGGFWPGPLTVIVPKRRSLPDVLSETEGIAVRIPDSEVARAVIRAAGGAVAATSANRSGEPPAQTAGEALAALGGQVAIVLDGGPAPGGVASTVVDCTGPLPRILRAGPISESQLLSLL